MGVEEPVPGGFSAAGLDAPDAGRKPYPSKPTLFLGGSELDREAVVKERSVEELSSEGVASMRPRGGFWAWRT